MDPSLQLLSTSLWGSVGGWGLALGAGLFVLTGFTVRGWETPKMRVRREAREDAANARTSALQDQLNSERKETADKALAALAVSVDTTHQQQGTISSIDNLLKKVPVTTPTSGDSVGSAGTRGELTT